MEPIILSQTNERTKSFHPKKVSIYRQSKLMGVDCLCITVKLISVFFLNESNFRNLFGVRSYGGEPADKTQNILRYISIDCVQLLWQIGDKFVGQMFGGNSIIYRTIKVIENVY